MNKSNKNKNISNGDEYDETDMGSVDLGREPTTHDLEVIEEFDDNARFNNPINIDVATGSEEGVGTDRGGTGRGDEGIGEGAGTEWGIDDGSTVAGVDTTTTIDQGTDEGTVIDKRTGDKKDLLS